MRWWVLELGNLCCRPQILSYNAHSCGTDGHNGLLRQVILKRFLDANHKGIRSDTEMGKEPLIKGLRTTKGNLTLDLQLSNFHNYRVLSSQLACGGRFIFFPPRISVPGICLNLIRLLAVKLESLSHLPDRTS